MKDIKFQIIFFRYMCVELKFQDKYTTFRVVGFIIALNMRFVNEAISFEMTQRHALFPKKIAAKLFIVNMLFRIF